MDKLNKYDCVELINTLNSPTLLEHLEALEASGARTMLIGGSAEAPRAYYSFSLPSGQGPTEIGVISSGLGTVPAALASKNGQRAVIGHDIWITWIDLETLATASSRRLDGVFFEFLAVDSDDETVVLHELGALRIDVAGSIKWSVDTDVVENWSTEPDGSLILNVMDGPSLVVSLVSGASGAVSTQHRRDDSARIARSE